MGLFWSFSISSSRFLGVKNEQFSFFQGVKNPTAEQIMAKSALDSIVGNLWQQRQESSGSSVGNQVTTRDPKSGTTVIFNNERGD